MKKINFQEIAELLAAVDVELLEIILKESGVRFKVRIDNKKYEIVNRYPLGYPKNFDYFSCGYFALKANGYVE